MKHRLPLLPKNYVSLLPFAKFYGISQECPVFSDLNMLYPINVSPKFSVSSQLLPKYPIS